MSQGDCAPPAALFRCREHHSTHALSRTTSKTAGPVCQEQSREALIEVLKVTLREALELNRQEALEAAL